MRSELQNLSNILDKTTILEETLDKLEARIESANKTLLNSAASSKWVVLSKAAKQVGMTTPALRHRIKRDHYPQGIVWKQRSPKSTIFIDPVKLEEYL